MINKENEKNRGDILTERLLDFTVQIIKLVNSLQQVDTLIKESDELCAVIAKSIITARTKK